MTYELEQFNEKGNLMSYARWECSKNTYYRHLKKGWKRHIIYGPYGTILGYIANNFE